MNTSGTPTSKLTPQMLQRRVQPLINVGYLGKAIKDKPFALELSTDLETLWEMNKNATLADTSNVVEHWRFTEFDAASIPDYWKYGWGGKIGNFMVNVDFFPLRFNKVSANKFRVVYPFKNIAATNGIKSADNQDYHDALYQFSYIKHRKALQVLTFNAAPVNAEMPFLIRDYGGKWRFVMDNLGADQYGRVIENKRRNKGQFIADFDLSIKPMYVEWLELIFHMRQPACVTVVNTCAPDPGNPAQSYNSANADCPTPANLVFTPEVNGSGNYVLAANTITCNGVPIVHVALTNGSATNTIGALITWINTNVGILGTWSAEGTTQIKLADSTCDEVVIPWVTS